MSENRIAAGVLPICLKTGRICLVQRAKNQSHPESWASFGGSVENGEKIKEAAHREFREETLYFGSYKLSSSFIYKNKDGDLTFYTYLGIFDEEFEVDIEGANEGMDYGWFELCELPENIIPGAKKMFESRKKYLQNIIEFYSKKH